MINLDSKRSTKDILDRELGDNYLVVYIDKDGQVQFQCGDYDNAMTMAYFSKMADAICHGFIMREME